MLIPRAALDNGTIGVRHGTTVLYAKPGSGRPIPPVAGFTGGIRQSGRACF
jgi:hypothetical protein